MEVFSGTTLILDIKNINKKGSAKSRSIYEYNGKFDIYSERNTVHFALADFQIVSSYLAIHE